MIVDSVLMEIVVFVTGSFGGGGVFRVNVGNSNEVMPEDISVTFNDVKGVSFD